MEANLAYYRRRSAEESAAAASAAHPEVRRVHLELAELYGARIAEQEAEDRIEMPRLIVAD